MVAARDGWTLENNTMKYSELHEAYWSNDAVKARDTLFKDAPTRVAWEIVEFFGERKGFDHWWDNIDDDIKDEIFEDLVAEVAALIL